MEYKLKELCLEITNECLLNCLHCSSDAGIGKGYMNKEIAFRVIHEFEEMGGEKLEISGGEPLTHPNLFEILEYSKKIRNFEVILYSVGIPKNSKKRIKKLSELIDGVEVSLHGPRMVTEKITGKDSYNLTKEFIENLVENGVKVNVHFVPMKLNYDYFYHVIKDCEEMGVEELKVLRLIPQGRAYLNWKKLHIPERELRDFIREVSGIKSRVKIEIGNPLRRYLGKKVSCKAGISTSLIKSNGNIYPCPAFKMNEYFSVGNVNESSLKEIWEKGFDDLRNFKKVTKCLECIAPWIMNSLDPYEVVEQLI